MSISLKICILSSGLFFLTGLLTGVWKYLHIRKSPDATAPIYVDISHRASLLYSFAVLVLIKFLEYSPYSETVNILSVSAPILFFALAIGTYIIHGILNDTENQLARPHKLGSKTLPNFVISVFTWALIVAEIGGFAVLFVGAARTILQN